MTNTDFEIQLPVARFSGAAKWEILLYSRGQEYFVVSKDCLSSGIVDTLRLPSLMEAIGYATSRQKDTLSITLCMARKPRHPSFDRTDRCLWRHFYGYVFTTEEMIEYIQACCKMGRKPALTKALDFVDRMMDAGHIERHSC